MHWHALAIITQHIKTLNKVEKVNSRQKNMDGNPWLGGNVPVLAIASSVHIPPVFLILIFKIWIWYSIRYYVDDTLDGLHSDGRLSPQCCCYREWWSLHMGRRRLWKIRYHAIHFWLCNYEMLPVTFHKQQSWSILFSKGTSRLAWGHIQPGNKPQRAYCF